MATTLAVGMCVQVLLAFLGGVLSGAWLLWERWQGERQRRQRAERLLRIWLAMVEKLASPDEMLAAALEAGEAGEEAQGEEVAA